MPIAATCCCSRAAADGGASVFELSSSSLGEDLDSEGADLYYMGGGQDRDQRLCAYDLAERKREALHAVAARGGVILAVCGGYQLLGHSYQLGEESLPGAGLIDLWTVRADNGDGDAAKRLIGNVAIEVALGPEGAPAVLAGFENHGGRTHLGPSARPLGRVLNGHGNNGQDGYEGVRDRSVIGTYLHGPLLPKNVWFADWLIQRALGLEGPLTSLDDELELRAHAEARRAAGL